MSQNTRNTPKSDTSKSEAPPKFTFNLGFSALMTALTVLVGCVVLSFMMGVIVGRGQQSLPGMNTLLHATQDTDEVKKNDDKKAVNTKSDPNNKLAQNQKPENIMSPEELKFASALKTQVAAQNTPAQSTPAKTDEIKPTTADKPESKPTTFDFVFQVSSLKDENAVDTLRAKLEGEGLRTKMSKSGAYYIVYVLLRGNNQRAEDIRARMIALRLGNPLLKQKTPVQ